MAPWPFLFGLTSFLGAALLFSVQPMAAKAVLPLLGGTPAVWTTCVAFFQTGLLAGYAYAHATSRRLGVRGQAVAHLALLGLAMAAFLPLAIVGEATPPTPGAGPIRWLVVVLATTIGPPFVALSATAPMLQRWYAGTGRADASDPYVLYAASNAGSLAALLAYPLAIEPRLRLAEQGGFWSIGFGVLSALMLACALAGWRARGKAAPERPDAIARGRWLRWVALAFVPSSLMLGVTTYLTTDIAPVPLLWVVPLALYLLSFILTFARRPVPRGWAIRALPIAAMLLAPALAVGLVKPFWIPLHLLAFALAAMVCHGELARDRPPARDLTGFYLAIALGGVIGGLFNALVAPFAFDRIAEYPMALVLACLAVPGPRLGPRGLAREAVVPAIIFALSAALVADFGGWSGTAAGALATVAASGLAVLVCATYRSRPARFALGLGAAMLAVGTSPGVEGRVLFRGRNFFGVLRVTSADGGRVHRLFHGNTLHGQQDRERPREPSGFYRREGPVGQVFEVVSARPGRSGVAVVGLGAGALAVYAEPGQGWTFYEIDPAVARVARDPALFTFLAECRAGPPEIVLGDARLRIREAPAHGFALIVLDAFSSDAVPVHLLTREALRLDLDKLAPGGLILFNISNRYLDFEPVLGALARAEGLACRVRYDTDPSRMRPGEQPTIWGVMAARESDLGPMADDPRWSPPRTRLGARAWTDDFSDPAAHLRFGARRPSRAIAEGPTMP